jgi:hypothetical protein
METNDGCFPLLTETMWQKMKPQLAEMAADTVSDIGANLYTVQARTATFLMAIERCHRFDLIDELAAVLLEAFGDLRPLAYIGVDAKERFLPTWR